jgi:hypothetical protein
MQGVTVRARMLKAASGSADSEPGCWPLAAGESVFADSRSPAVFRLAVCLFSFFVTSPACGRTAHARWGPIQYESVLGLPPRSERRFGKQLIQQISQCSARKEQVHVTATEEFRPVGCFAA